MATEDPDKSQILTKALKNASKEMDITINILGKVIGKDRSTFSRGGIQPDSKAGELGLMFIRCYRSLYALVGGDPEKICHWMHTYNKGTQGVPVEQIQTVVGLIRVMYYLDAIKAKR